MLVIDDSRGFKRVSSRSQEMLRSTVDGASQARHVRCRFTARTGPEGPAEVANHVFKTSKISYIKDLFVSYEYHIYSHIFM